ncbi:hypothetical protein [Pseudomonas mohnii]|uniref:hypothetical protein n=1 Tax=Pseudomonas mohnii TaxID=395600 RepID=UPI001428CA2B|nr:hypothetical protein [Pseudomonas mohnii]
MSQAIEAMLSAGVLDLSKAAVELRAAKVEYERLVHLKSLEMNTSAALAAS